MYEPLVSIIIPVYNGSDYVREAINSALAQTYKNIEVIVVNDGSSDDGVTDRIVRLYGNKIRYYVKENGGVSSALNMGIWEMAGEYFSWLSHDDVYEPDKIEKQVEALRTNKFNEDTLIYCKHMCINEFSEPGKESVLHFTPYKVYDSTEVLIELLKKDCLNGCCLLIPKKALIECGMFDEKLRFCQDVFMWYKIFMRDYSLFCIDDVSVKNRIHSKQLTQTGQALFRKECADISNILVNKFAKISTIEYNFLRMYLLSDARYFGFKRVKEIIKIGQSHNLISKITALKAYFICGYGIIRPMLRRVYYAMFKRINTK